MMGTGAPCVAVLTIMSVIRGCGSGRHVVVAPLSVAQLICTIPPLITSVALPLIVVRAPTPPRSRA